MDTFRNLDALLTYMLSQYEELNREWRNSEAYLDLNLRRCQVADIKENSQIMDLIWNYCSFLQKKQYKLLPGISRLQSPENKIHVRIKQANSIQNKISTYMKKHIEGKVSVNKCFNDLLGFRIIIDADFSFEQLKEHLEERFDSLKIINSSKNEYNAYHVYLHSDNKIFPWELQVWKKYDEESNLQSHFTYKQDYTTWEQKHKNT